MPRLISASALSTLLEHRDEIQADKVRDALLFKTGTLTAELTAQDARNRKLAWGRSPDHCIAPAIQRRVRKQIVAWIERAYRVNHSHPVSHPDRQSAIHGPVGEFRLPATGWNRNLMQSGSDVGFELQHVIICI